MAIFISTCKLNVYRFFFGLITLFLITLAFCDNNQPGKESTIIEKLGLPAGYHVCDRGWVGKSPKTGQWVTNESSSSKSNPVPAFNSFVRKIMDGVHSGMGERAKILRDSAFGIVDFRSI